MSSAGGPSKTDRRRRRTPAPSLSWPYVRTSNGVWHYEWGGPVPGARDLVLSDVFAFPRVDGPAGTAVAVPAAQCDTDPRLTWCAAYWDPRSQGDTFLVPLRAWTSHDDLLGMDAPELSARHLLDYAAVAQIAGCSPRTVANYLAKALMPQPVARLGGSPVWPRPLIQHWLDTRTDAPATRSARAATRPARARPTAEPRHDDEVLEIDEEEDFWLQLLDRQDR